MSLFLTLATIILPHGIRGAVLVRSETDPPEKLLSYPLWFADAPETASLTVRLLSSTPKGLLLSIGGITTRNQAETLRGKTLVTTRDALPLPEEGEYYQSDLVGKPLMDEQGRVVGTVQGFHNFGAGDVVDVQLPDKNGQVLLPFAMLEVAADVTHLMVPCALWDALAPKP